MTKPTFKSSDLSPTPDNGVMDAQWQPSWLQWLISVLTGTVETEKQIAWLKKYNAEQRMRHEEWLKNQRKEDERDEKLAALELKLNAMLQNSSSSLTPPMKTD